MHRAPQELRTYFLTIVTAQRRRLFQVTATAELMRDTLFHYRDEGKYALHAYVVMPDHIHLCLTPAPDISLEKSMQFIKGGFSFRLKSKLDVWMRGYNEAQIRTPEKFSACRRYIEDNPVRKHLCEAPLLYLYSSADDLRIDPAPEHLRG
ncbi:transposase [Granulicella sp. 5B5]|nr:transposase [Granulicella sp. 5B5]